MELDPALLPQQLVERGKPVFVVCFKTRVEQFIYKAGSRVDMLVTLEENEYRGSRGISVRLKDIRPAGFALPRLKGLARCPAAHSRCGWFPAASGRNSERHRH